MLRNLRKWFFGWLKGGPHLVLGDPLRPYLYRWYVLPRNDWLNIYLHKFLRDDDDRALHDHPWQILSIILKGGYIEHLPDAIKFRNPGQCIFRDATHTHRIQLYRKE